MSIKSHWLTWSVLAAAISIHSSPAHATGGVNCTSDDAMLTLDFNAVFSYSVPGLFQTSGTLAITDDKLPVSIRKLALSQDMLKQQWFVDQDILLDLYKETEGELPFAVVDLIIRAKAVPDDELTYEGTYTLKRQLPEPKADGTADIITTSGKVSCSAG